MDYNKWLQNKVLYIKMYRKTQRYLNHSVLLVFFLLGWSHTNHLYSESDTGISLISLFINTIIIHWQCDNENYDTFCRKKFKNSNIFEKKHKMIQLSKILFHTDHLLILISINHFYYASNGFLSQSENVDYLLDLEG